MTPFTTLTSVIAPLLRDNIDTDAIIPSREIRSPGKTGLAEGLFAGWRYAEGRAPDAAFVRNRPAYADARILAAGDNFGCGSSREQAVWALAEYGIRANVILPGLMDTPMAVDTRARASNRPRADIAAERDARVPLRRRMGTAWDVANAALFLASDEASFVTGVSFPVDGGLLLKVG